MSFAIRKLLYLNTYLIVSIAKLSFRLYFLLMICQRIATSTLDFSVATQLETSHVINAPLHIEKLETSCNLCMYIVVVVVAFGVLVLFGHFLCVCV